MLKKRIAANLVVRNGIVVQSKNFTNFLPIGKPAIAIEYLNQWGIDEIILTDITASSEGRGPDFESIRNATRNCYVPLTVGGGINNLNQIKELMQCGADKISINQAALYNKQLITDAAHIFGDQCVVVSVDILRTESGYKVYDYLKKDILPIDLIGYIKDLQNHGAGEILVNAVHKDGTYTGYDIDLMNIVCRNVSIPVIGLGGAKNAKDFLEVFEKTKVSAASAANFFHFTEHSVNTTKAIVHKELDIRLETYADYLDAVFDHNMRLIKKDEEILENMLFLKIEKELI